MRVPKLPKLLHLPDKPAGVAIILRRGLASCQTYAPAGRAGRGRSKHSAVVVVVGGGVQVWIRLLDSAATCLHSTKSVTKKIAPASPSSHRSETSISVVPAHIQNSRPT